MTVMKFSAQSVWNMLWGLFLCLMLLGSFAYIYNSSFAIGVLLALISGPLFLIKFLTKRRTGVDLFMLLSLGLLVLFAVLGMVVFPTDDNFRYVKAFAFNFFAFPIVMVILEKKGWALNFGVLLYAAIICFIAALQISYLYFGFGLDPTRVGVADYMANDAFAFAGIRSIFANQNDFAMICLFLIIYVIFVSRMEEKYKSLLTAIFSLMVVLAASRTCIVCLVLVLGTYYLTSWKRWKYFIIGISVAVACFFAISAYSSRSSENSYWVTKITTIIDLGANFLSGGVSNISDGSAHQRMGGYGEFFDKFDMIGFGSFRAKDYGYILSDSLLMQDPHSLLIELSLLYGYVGLLFFAFMVFWVFRCSRLGSGAAKAAILTLSVILATFVSSSEVNFPAFWVIVFICFIGVRTRQASYR